MKISEQEIVIRLVANEVELSQMFYVRWLVLRKPLGMALGTEQDQYEGNSFQLVAIFGDRIIGTARLRKESENLGIISFVAVLSEFRDRGIGTKLVEKLIEKAQQEKLQVVRLKSRITAIDFYKKIGFSEQGEFFDYLTIPHITMEIKL
ncbi:GNAT family N-acetyltransferase [Aerosakkonemataceae cyanobacterium BLCC-F50]|uniref:GNAT family N-acetyltransferase n=1 Tax=Floridaenema flaviceps BLCC-F50 TaxID=3153642 RepID=A0ABV4XTK2_9CYAN